MKKFLTGKNLIVALISGVLMGEMVLVSSVTAAPATRQLDGTSVSLKPAGLPNCKIGDIGPGGGIVFYVSKTKINVQPGISLGGRCLEAAPKTWNGSPSDKERPWGCIGTSIGGLGIGIGTGAANTKKIMVGCVTLDIPARRAGDLTFGSKTDWFLPSKAELNLMYTNLASAGLGDFVTGRYWSSSRTGPRHAWSQSFELGWTDSSDKFNGGQVRPVRVFG